MFKLKYIFLISSLCIRLSLPQILGYSDDVEKSDFIPRVVNGWPAKLGDVPYQLAFKSLTSRYRRLYHTFCGGTIIGTNKVLSAAHCFEDRKRSACSRCFKPGQVRRKRLDRSFAVAGQLSNTARYERWDSMVNGQWRRLKSMFIPTNYRFPKNDIAVGFTRRPFVYNTHVNFIPYATQYRDYVGKCLVSGYGRVSKTRASHTLLLAHLDLHSNSWCSRLHRRNMRKFICSSALVSDVQKGDSGGPLVCSGTNDPAESTAGVLVGVVSGNRARSGSFFTRVSSFREFVSRGRGRVLHGSCFMILICLLNSGILLF